MISTFGTSARLLVAGLLAVSGATLGGAVLAGPASATNAAAADEAWLVAAHQSNLAEIAAGRDAQENATNDDVSALGEHLVEDHTRLDRSVQQLAEKYDVTLPDAPNEAQQSLLAQVKQNSGEAYDRAWVRAQTTSHLQTKAATQREISGGDAEDVVAAARTSAPVVQRHIDELASISADLGIASPTSVNGGTGGQAAEGSSSVPATVTIAAGLGLLAAAGFAVYRRRATPVA